MSEEVLALILFGIGVGVVIGTAIKAPPKRWPMFESEESYHVAPGRPGSFLTNQGDRIIDVDPDDFDPPNTPRRPRMIIARCDNNNCDSERKAEDGVPPTWFVVSTEVQAFGSPHSLLACSWSCVAAVAAQKEAEARKGSG